MEEHWDPIRRGVIEFGSHYLTVQRMSLIGKLSDQDLISSAVACFCGPNVYDAMRKVRQSEKEKEETTKWKTKQNTCPSVPCWRVLRQVK